MNTVGTKTVANKDSYVDYGYDDNGNLVKDRNKDIGTSGSNGIVYNHLNLPCRITVEGKGTITYIYDALGNKLKKIVEDNTVNPVKKTTSIYMFGVYENDVLQFLGQEEGRLRPVVDGSGTLTGFSADYFLKDHLGNVRMVLKDEEKTSTSAVTFEDVNLTEEQTVFERVDIGRTPKPVVNDNSKVQLLSKSSNAVGVEKLSKVMAGDRLHVQVEYYTPDAGTDNSGADGLGSVLSSIAGLLNGSAAPTLLEHGGTTVSGELGSSASFTSFLSQQGSGVPSAQQCEKPTIRFLKKIIRNLESDDLSDFCAYALLF